MKILIEALHGIGDMVCALPMISRIREKWSDAEITVLIKFEVNKYVLQSSKINIDHIVILNVYSKDVIKTFKTLLSLRRQAFDIFVSAINTPVKKARLFAQAIGASNNVGLQVEKKLYFDLLNDHYHFVDASFLALETLKITSTKSCNPRLYISDHDRMMAKKEINSIKGKQVIGLCIGNADFSYRNRYLRRGKVFTRGWGIENMTILLEKLLLAGYGVILLGGKLEEGLLKTIPKELLSNPLVINMVNKTNLLESMSLVSLCELVVGVDTGMMHIADALGVRTLSIFGPTNPKTHGAYSEKAKFVEAAEPCKYCYGSSMYVECLDRKCLNKITPEIVFQEVRKNLTL